MVSIPKQIIQAICREICSIFWILLFICVICLFDCFGSFIFDKSSQEAWTCGFFFQETDDLQRKQNWYQQNQISLQKADEQKYLAYVCEAMFRIRVLEARLNRSTLFLFFRAILQSIVSFLLSEWSLVFVTLSP